MLRIFRDHQEDAIYFIAAIYLIGLSGFLGYLLAEYLMS